MKSNKEFIIQFVGLKLGVHSFEFEIGTTFFSEREYSIIDTGSVRVLMTLEKKETMMIADFLVNGIVSTYCDRCNDPLELEINGTYHLIYKFGLEPSDDETLFVLHPDAYELDVSGQLYEFITLSLPSRLIHPKGGCNEEMVALIKQYSHHPEDAQESEEWEDEDDFDEEDDWEDDDDTDDDPIDPRWSVLKNLN